ncbi:UDP-4-amino-4,6-dideoxy-N-acetyl-beta-L-altrosamine N-acetyltransferase [Clostridium sp. CMCC3677]|uniref:UDP-4-amino-4, 6-dideoxy-N-acetyl-beta-L-altrosamine N-acetyltransferase n=1 Tax=Clostridium sp. CMCC3677 TaxID=2949963 RepID=UPI0013F05E24|nr:UDP-4-amino-4,6-dideoxy-N-acetyl-beta-L-altrosamine N-acetyltransferase [Clostridium sp. CMCC3677]NFG60635.1 UDP-4-amino-4,6-dideoxy-N-acetyl-beta-L-altrosamine N-acetyltransferase [Clostridium botulinum]NFQ10579.1 UDP-4-amino-4,6-dideoxy-N-acetyl-beta-L-altrosamine N-acetyltransferase [Clostridium botulinum]
MSLKLRRVNESDLKNIMKWRMLPEVTKYMYTDPVLDLEKQKLWFNKIQKSANELYWIIVFDNTDIGLLSINEIDYINKRCAWAYYIADTSFRGKGIATNLECNIYNYVFNTLKLNKLCCEVFESNKKVIAIHEKFGSIIEGIFKEHIFKNEEFYNIVCMSIIKEKWDEIKENYNYKEILIE